MKFAAILPHNREEKKFYEDYLHYFYLYYIYFNSPLPSPSITVLIKYEVFCQKNLDRGL